MGKSIITNRLSLKASGDGDSFYVTSSGNQLFYNSTGADNSLKAVWGINFSGVSVPISYSASYCPGGTVAEGHCFMVEHVGGTNYADSKAVCAANGGNLASVTSATIDNALTQLKIDAISAWGAGSKYWIGGNDLASEGSFVWENGAAFAYTNWNGGEPNNAGNEDCLEKNGGWARWSDALCTNTSGYFCEYN